ncbi:MAG: SDR family NAD(P)-dependent oxidoreductase [Leptolyngbya sp.]|nr:SDR family NAD(P)-dependent oxidoreductase [Candidatus Melainabacteria bacterium]
MKISNNTILITGGTSGIGRGLAEALHKRNNKVIVAGRRKALIDEITKANPGIEGLVLDVSDAGKIAEFVATVKEKYPGLNVLVNNAGIARMEDWKGDKVDLAQVQDMISTNITAVINLTAAFVPFLKNKEGATLITTTSGLAFVPMAAAPTYSATKAFLHSWLQGVRHQLRDSGIEVLELAPPYVQTELGGEAQKKDPKALPLDEYIKAVVQIIESGKTPDGEIIEERAKFLRDAERNGSYEKVFADVNAMEFATV